jgi:peptide/nickel transport system permease protein
MSATAPFVANGTSTARSADSPGTRFLGVLRQLLRSPSFDIGLIIVLFWIVDAIFWHEFVPQNPQTINPLLTLTGPSAAHWFGTDWLGRPVPVITAR